MQPTLVPRAADLGRWPCEKGTTAIEQETTTDGEMTREQTTQQATVWDMACPRGGDHLWNLWNLWPDSSTSIGHRWHGLHRCTGTTTRRRSTEANHSVEANRRPAAPPEAGHQLGSPFSAGPYFLAAVADLTCIR